MGRCVQGASRTSRTALSSVRRAPAVFASLSSALRSCLPAPPSPAPCRALPAPAAGMLAPSPLAAAPCSGSARTGLPTAGALHAPAASAAAARARLAGTGLPPPGALWPPSLAAAGASAEALVGELCTPASMAAACSRLARRWPPSSSACAQQAATAASAASSPLPLQLVACAGGKARSHILPGAHTYHTLGSALVRSCVKQASSQGTPDLSCGAPMQALEGACLCT